MLHLIGAEVFMADLIPMGSHVLQVILWAGLVFGCFDAITAVARVGRTLVEGGDEISRPMARAAGDSLVIAWVWSKLRGRRRTAPPELEPEPVSLVVLNRETLVITEHEVESAARCVFGTQWEHHDNRITVRPPLYLVQFRSWTFGVVHKNDHFFESTLMELRNSPEAMLRRAATEHRSWLSVDLLKAPDGIAWDTGYSYAGPLLAELAGPDVCALGAPGPGLWAPWEESFRNVLRTKDPLEAFRTLAEPPQGILSETVGRLAAQREAQDRWTEFQMAFESHRPGSQFFVMAQLSRGERSELTWLGVEHLDGNRINGRLDRDLRTLQLSAGAPVVVSTNDVWDWLVFDGSGGREGHFSQKFDADLARH